MFSKKPFKGTARTLSDQQIKPAVAPAPAKKTDPGIVNVKFELRIGGQVKRIDSKFATQQKLSSLYVYLENEVFEQVSKLEIVQAFPRAIIPNDDTKSLAAMGLKRQVLLQVNFESGKLRPSFA